MFLRRAIEFAFLRAAFLFAAFALTEEQKVPERYSQSEMRKLVIDSLDKCDLDMESMRDWVFSENEVFINEKYSIVNGGTAVDEIFVPSFRKEYVWFVRDGIFVRSPTLINGVAVNPAQKAAAEEKWFKEKKKSADPKGLLDYFVDFANNYQDSIHKKPVSRYFVFKKSVLCYPFISGQFSYEGEKMVESHKAAEILYKPTLKEVYGKHASKDLSAFASSKNLIFFIIPEEHQIVKMTFGSESVPVEALTGIISITMGKLSEGNWLPQKFSSINFTDAVTIGSRGKYYYTREYHSFKKAHVETNLSFDDAGADSNPLHEDVKSKTQFDMKTPVPPKEETPPSKKDH